LIFRPEVVVAFREQVYAMALELVTKGTIYNRHHLRRKTFSKEAMATAIAVLFPKTKLVEYTYQATQEALKKREQYRIEHAEENKARAAASFNSSRGKSKQKGKAKAQPVAVAEE